jgi:hypothetical protein
LNHPPILFGQGGHHLVQNAPLLIGGHLDVGAGLVAGDLNLGRLAIRIGRLIGECQGLDPAPADPVDAQVGGDRHQPGLEAPFLLIRGQLTVGLEKGILRGVAGILFVVEHAQGQAIHPVLMDFDQFLEAFGVPRQDSPDSGPFLGHLIDRRRHISLGRGQRG